MLVPALGIGNTSKTDILPLECGMNAKRVEWGKIKQGVVRVEGFPSDLRPGPASSFGKENLKRLLDENVVITFQGKTSLFITFIDLTFKLSLQSNTGIYKSLMQLPSATVAFVYLNIGK